MLPIKYLRDLKGFLLVRLDPEELEGLDAEEAAELDNAKEISQSCIRRFFGIDGVNVARPAIYRAATAHLLQALDHALFQVCGAGFEMFLSADTKIDFSSRCHSGETCRHQDRPIVEA